MSAARLRVVTEDDWELWRDLRFRVLSTDPEAFGSTLEREQEYDEADWRGRVSRGRAVVAYLDDDRPVGMGGLFEDAPGSVTVVAMWVAPEHRGRGVGRLVLDDLLASARAEGRRIRLWVAEANPARRLYEAAGFVATGRTEPMRPGAVQVKVELEEAPQPPGAL